DKGTQYIEGMAGLWCTSLGFNEKRLAAAATKQLESLPFMHTFAHRSTAPAIELAERLVDIAPNGISKAFFVNSGSEAVDTAIKFVWYYHNAIGKPNKKKIISRTGGYHGVTIAAGSLTGLPYVHQGFDLPAIGVLHTGHPHYYRFAEGEESEEAFASRLAGNLDKLIQEEGPDNIGAFIAEPVMGAGGVIIPPRTYFEKIQAVLKKYDILMIADEVICGFARTGNMWGSETYNIQPDMMTCAKQLSSAYVPIGAVLLTDQIYQAFTKGSDQYGTFGTGNTYGGHPVAAAVALETLNIYQERNIVEHVRQMGERFEARLKGISEHPLVGETRSAGLIGGLTIVEDKSSKKLFSPDVKAAPKIVEQILKNELMLRPLPNDAIGICPPLIINEKEVDILFDRIEHGLDDAMPLLT
ncbi:MAG: aminotransferase, partial [Pseudomonadota bacterium]